MRRSWSAGAVDNIFNRLGKLLITDPVLNVVEFGGQFAVAPGGHIFRRIVEHGEYEPTLTAYCRQFLDPERDAIDVGANIGFYTILMARTLPKRRVLAVEPMPNSVARLKRNIFLNGVSSSVIVFEGVASDQPGWVEIKSVAGLEEYSSLGAMEHPSIVGQRTETHRVAALKLDQLVEEHKLDCGFLKVDVEGAEHLVLAGAQHVLARHRPVVMAELSDRLLRKNASSALAIVRMFEGIGYRVSDPLHPTEKPGYREYGDILCVPVENLSC
jgi:FkbM family methyltransferase